MRATKLYMILIVLLLGSLTGNSVYAQYAPGARLPYIGSWDDYDWLSGQKGFVRIIGTNESLPIDKRLFSIWAGGNNGERFRVSANGTTSIVGAFNGKPALNFYTANNYYLGSIGFPGEELTITGLYGIRLNPNKENKVFITTNQTSIFNSLHLSLIGHYADQGGTFKMGRNQEPLMVSNFSGKRLRIGAKSGIGFWGDGNAGTNDTPNLLVNADGTVLVSNAITMKIGRNGAPTVKGEINGKWLRVGGQNGVAFWGNGNMDNEDNPHVLIKDNKLIVGQMTSPDYALNVGGSIYTEANGIKTFFGKDIDKDDGWIGTMSKHGLYLGTNNKSCLYLDADYENVYVGLIDTFVSQIRQEFKKKYRLFVAKGVLSEDYGISPQSSWSDFVFNEDYALKTIAEVEEFISENDHLPGVPSAKQVAEEGYSQHDMNKILLQKIEELTLYTIQQQKEIDSLKVRLQDSFK